MKPLVSLSLLLFFCLAASTLLQAQDKGPQLRVYDVGAIVAVRREESGWPMKLPLREALHSLGDSGKIPSLEQVSSGIPGDSLVDLVQQALGDVWDAADVSIGLRGNHLWVRQTPARQERIEACLEYLEQEVNRTILVQLFRVPAELVAQAGGGAILGRSQTLALLGEGKCAPLARQLLRSGSGGVIRSGRSIPFLGGYDVEVAQESSIADPLVFLLKTGLVAKPWVHLLPTGEIYLRVTVRSTHLTEMRVVETGATWVGKLQLPVVDSELAAASGVLPSGGSLVVGTSQGAQGQLFLVRVQELGRRGQGHPPGLVVLSGGLAGVPVWRLPPLRAVGPTVSGYDEQAARAQEGALHLDPDSLVDMVHQNIEPDVWDENPAGSLSLVFMKPFFVFHGLSRLVDKIHNLLARIQQESTRSYSLEIRQGFLDEETFRAAMGPDANLEKIVTSLENVAYVSTVEGESFALALGRERAYIKDFDVEIAQGASIADPRVASIFTGTILQGRLKGAANGALFLEGESLVRDPVEFMATFHENTDDVGPVEVPRTTAWRLRLGQPMKLGDWSLLGGTVVEGHPGGLVILARVFAP